MNEQEVKELADFIAIHMYPYFSTAEILKANKPLEYACIEEAARSAINAGYSKSTSSLKRISDEEIEIVANDLYEQNITGYKAIVQYGADKQLASDQKVVAGKDKEIADLKAKFQPEPQGEIIDIILPEICRNSNCSRYGHCLTSPQLDPTECTTLQLASILSRKLSTLIQAEKGKVAKEISDAYDELIKCYPNDGCMITEKELQKFDATNKKVSEILAKYSER